MASERTSDLERLNALIDGELTAAERADMAARIATDRDLASAHATLARLKAATAALAGEPPMIALRRRWWLPIRRHAGAVAACLAATIGAAGLVHYESRPADTPAAVVAPGSSDIALASLPAGTAVPRLDAAGLKLTHLAVKQGGIPLFTATYRGSHGCRLDLAVWPATEKAASAPGSGSYRWAVGPLAYELTAHGMPERRFRAIAGAAEQQTRSGPAPAHIDRRLREASRGAPPCLG